MEYVIFYSMHAAFCLNELVSVLTVRIDFILSYNKEASMAINVPACSHHRLRHDA